MGAIPDYAAYALRERPTYDDDIMIADVAPTLSRINSLFTTQGGAVPTTAAVPSRTIAGAVGQDNPNAGTQRWITKLAASMRGNGVLTLYDRLSHQGGLSAIVTTAQTTNLPTAALTRNTDGVGVMLAIEIYTQIGTTATTVSMRYTNEAGTAGQTTPAIAFGGTNNREIRRFFQVPLQSGDRGVRSVESVTVLATTGTAGAFGVTLYRPITSLRFTGYEGYDPDLLLELGYIPEIPTDACLCWLLQMPSLYSSTGGCTVSLGLDER